MQEKKRFKEDMLNFGMTLSNHLGGNQEKLMELVQEVGISRATIYNYIESKSSPNLDIAFHISKFLGFSLDKLTYNSITSEDHPEEWPEWKQPIVQNRKDMLSDIDRTRTNLLDGIVTYFEKNGGQDKQGLLLQEILKTYMRCSIGACDRIRSEKAEALAHMQLQAISALSQLWSSTLLEIMQNDSTKGILKVQDDYFTSLVPDFTEEDKPG